MSEHWPSYEDDTFETLFRRYWKKVYTICAYACADEDVAKDLTQDIFLSIWQRRMIFESEAGFEKYLNKAAKYRALAYLRDNPIPGELNADIDADHHSPEKILILKHFTQQVESAVRSLPEPSKTIFLLNREEELTYQQIALRQGVSLKTIEFHISKALRLLRKNLGLVKS